MRKLMLMLPQGCNPECKGCSHRDWSMTDSLEQKRAFIKGKLSEWASCVEPVRSVTKDKRWGYRTKTTLSARFNGTIWEFGMWRRDEFIPIPNCPVHTPGLNKTLALLADSFPRERSFALAYIVISGAQAVLVIKSKLEPTLSWLSEEVVKGLASLGIEGLWYHMNPSTGRRIFEKSEWRLIWGKPRSTDYNGLLYGPAAFQQLIPELYNQSLLEAENFLNPSIQSAVIDLYCGTGNSMLRWAKRGADVLGIELGGEAVECARLNVPQAMVLRGACRQRIPQIADWADKKRSQGKEILLYVNPPRTGLETEVFEWITKQGLPIRIAYLSCSPGTLSKNLKLLCTSGYRLVRCVPFDFFPQTHHVETLALLEKVSADTH
ncbi:MAG: class I SAM-dependent RNA methyltransferase [Bacteroidales bacterium]|nr:class I SAM-dependent RNA methyltransferase [Bacteroidales bacterium]